MIAGRYLSKCSRNLLACNRLFSTVPLNHRMNVGLYKSTSGNNKLILPLCHLELHVKRLSISIFDTPNPHSTKFFVDQVILDGNTSPVDFSSEVSSTVCELASQIFQVPGVKRVYIGQDFVTVSKLEDAEWNALQAEIKSILLEYFKLNNFVSISQNQNEGNPADSAEEDAEEENGDLVAMIQELIETKIRPTVQEDGGDIIYKGFKNGIVRVKLQGSCSGCPSSEVTLKRGIQNMLQFYVPEVLDVVQVEDEKDEMSNHSFEKFDESLKNNT